MKIILSNIQYEESLTKLSQKIVKAYANINNLHLVAIQTGGVLFGEDLIKILQINRNFKKIPYGQLDITFYRDDVLQKMITPDKMNLPFSIENKNILLLDDVLFTGRTIKAALDALLDYGRPANVKLCVLIDRFDHRQFPIQPDFYGAKIKTKRIDKIKFDYDKNGKKILVLK